MIVESMSFQQMRSQALRDYATVKHKAFAHVPTILKVMRKTRMTKLFKYYDLVIESTQNKWMYSIATNGKPQDTFIGNMCYFYSQKGYAAISVTEDNSRVNYYTEHFFQRYSQRRGLQNKSIKDIMITFIHENPQMVLNPTTNPNEEKVEVTVQTKYGVGFGTMHSKINFLEMRTFINNDMLKGDQIECSYQIEKKFNLPIERPKEKSLKERPYLYNIIFPLPHHLTNLLQKGASRYNTAFLKFL